MAIENCPKCSYDIEYGPEERAAGFLVCPVCGLYGTFEVMWSDSTRDSRNLAAV